MAVFRASLVFALACAVAGSPSVAAAANAQPLRIAVTLAPQAFVAKRLAPAGTVVVTMIPPNSSEETFEPSPSLIAALESSRLYFRVGHDGLPFETRIVAPFLARHPAVRVVTLADGETLAPLEDSTPDATPATARAGATDPHLWMSPAIMLRAAERLAAALQDLEPAEAATIAARLARLRSEVLALAEQMRAAAGAAPGTTFVAYHPTYGYLARDFGLRQLGVEVEGKELGLAGLVRLTLEARARRARLLFVTPGPMEKNGRVLAESIGARVVAVDPLSEDWLATLRTVAGALASQAEPTTAGGERTR